MILRYGLGRLETVGVQQKTSMIHGQGDNSATLNLRETDGA